MTVYDFFKNLSLSGWTSLVVIACMFIEITPIQINPIGWLGKRLNKDMYSRVSEIESKLDNHIAEGYRNYILNFQRELINNPDIQFTFEEWKKAIKNCEDYEGFCKANNISNDIITQAIIFIRDEYQMALKNNNIMSLPTPRVSK